MQLFKLLPYDVRNLLHYTMVKARHINLNLDVESRLNLDKLDSYSFGEGSRITKTSIEPYFRMGRYSYISGPAIINSERNYPTTIGNFCSLGGCRIITRNHPITYPSTQPVRFNFREEEAATMSKNGGVSVGHDVWIGHGATILSGVTIGNGAIIAAGAVVTKSVEPYSIVGGIPASKIKERFNQEQQNEMESIKWWEWSRAKLEKNKPFFSTDLSTYHGPLFDLILE